MLRIMKKGNILRKIRRDKMFTTYEYENRNIIVNDRISEYCKAENLDEEYFRFSLRKIKNHSIAKNFIAAIVLVINNIFQH